jgi:hypothetical protein
VTKNYARKHAVRVIMAELGVNYATASRINAQRFATMRAGLSDQVRLPEDSWSDGQTRSTRTTADPTDPATRPERG